LSCHSVSCFASHHIISSREIIISVPYIVSLNTCLPYVLSFAFVVCASVACHAVCSCCRVENCGVILVCWCFQQCQSDRLDLDIHYWRPCESELLIWICGLLAASALIASVCPGFRDIAYCHFLHAACQNVLCWSWLDMDGQLHGQHRRLFGYY
jgi:hypothetical protein